MTRDEWKAISTTYHEGYKDFMDNLELLVENEKESVIFSTATTESSVEAHNRLLAGKAKIEAIENIIALVSVEPEKQNKKIVKPVGL